MNLTTNDVPVFTRTELCAFMDDCIADDVVGMIWGPPGVGKSQVVEWYCQQRNYTMVHVHWGQYAIHSAAGVVVPNMTTFDSTYTRPDYIARLWEIHERGETPLLFIDEAPNAPKDVAAIANQIMDEHRVGEYALPPNCLVVAAGNRHTDGAHACNMVATTANRIAHAVFLGASVAEFVEWGEATGRLHPVMMHHLQSHPDELYDFDRTRAINNTHRSIEMACRLLDRHMAAGRGLVDAAFLSRLSSRILRTTAVGMAVSFALQGKTTPIADIVSDPAGAPLPADRGVSAGDELAATYMQMRQCVAALTDDKKVGQAIATYIGRLSAEMRAAFLAMVMRRYNEHLMSMGVLQIFQQAYRDEFIAVVDAANAR